MKHFRLVATGLDDAAAAALAEIETHPEFWKLLTLRQDYPCSAHADTETIVLRGPTTTEDIFNNFYLADFPQMAELPQVCDFLQPIIEKLPAALLGRVMVVKLKAGGRITPHVDEGAYARFYARFHAVLKSSPDCLFTVGDETVYMAPGEVWWFNHQVTHSVQNGGPDRTHVIFDACAPGYTGALSSSPSGAARPCGMKRAGACAESTCFDVRLRGCRERGRFIRGAVSPFSSWTRNPASTLHCCHGRLRPGARLIEFDNEGSSRRRIKQEVPRCKFCIHAVLGLTCIKTWSWLGCAV